MTTAINALIAVLAVVIIGSGIVGAFVSRGTVWYDVIMAVASLGLVLLITILVS